MHSELGIEFVQYGKNEKSGSSENCSEFPEAKNRASSQIQVLGGGGGGGRALRGYNRYVSIESGSHSASMRYCSKNA